MGLFSPVQSAADGCPADLTQVSCRQTNQTPFLVADNDAIPAGQTAAGQTFLWHRTAALETMEENPLRLHGHWATEPHVPHTAPILLTTNRVNKCCEVSYTHVLISNNGFDFTGSVIMS